MQEATDIVERSVPDHLYAMEIPSYLHYWVGEAVAAVLTLIPRHYRKGKVARDQLCLTMILPPNCRSFEDVPEGERLVIRVHAREIRCNGHSRVRLWARDERCCTLSAHVDVSFLLLAKATPAHGLVMPISGLTIRPLHVAPEEAELPLDPCIKEPAAYLVTKADDLGAGFSFAFVPCPKKVPR